MAVKSVTSGEQSHACDAYRGLFIIVVNALGYAVYSRGLRAYEISAICSSVVYSVRTLIFGLIVN